jgi:hypothetical protein
VSEVAEDLRGAEKAFKGVEEVPKEAEEVAVPLR